MTQTAFLNASQPALTPDQAYEAVLQGYRAVKSAQEDDRLEIATELVNSEAFAKTQQPWFVRDIAHACFENLPFGDRRVFNHEVQISPVLQEFASIYPRASEWYKREENVLAYDHYDGIDKNPKRAEWQTARRTVLAGLDQAQKEGIPQAQLDILSKIYVEKLAKLPVLEAIAAKAPWSALDIYAALADSHPAEGRHEFAQTHLLASEAFATVSQECPQLAEYYEKRVAAMAPVAVQQVRPSQDRAPQ